MRKFLAYTILAVICSVKAVHAQNANASATQAANLALSNAIELSFTSSNPDMNIAFYSLNDMLNGVETATHEVRVRSNKEYKVTVKPSSTNFTYSGNSLIGTLLKVSNVMKVQVVSNNTGGTQPYLAQILGWQSFNVLGSPVTLLNNCDPGGNQTFTVKYKATPGVNCVAGNYTVDMVYTATQQ